MNVVFDKYNIDEHIANKILYEYVQNPKYNYNNIIKYLKSVFKRSCSSNCRFRHFSVCKGEICYAPVPQRHVNSKCLNCNQRYVSKPMLFYCERCSYNCEIEYNYYHERCK